jgi:ubiquinone/menaquinone biosynthesis C-methylase UbiE
MPAESMTYPDNFFDLIFVCDILHHCDLPKTLAEIVRVAKSEAAVIINEPYTHSILQRVRGSRFVDKWLYPLVVKIIYSGEPYITEDERKLTESDVAMLRRTFAAPSVHYFDSMVNRIAPKHVVWLSKADRMFLKLLGRIGGLAAGRFVALASVRK